MSKAKKRAPDRTTHAAERRKHNDQVLLTSWAVFDRRPTRARIIQALRRATEACQLEHDENARLRALGPAPFTREEGEQEMERLRAVRESIGEARALVTHATAKYASELDNAFGTIESLSADNAMVRGMLLKIRDLMVPPHQGLEPETEREP